MLLAVTRHADGKLTAREATQLTATALISWVLPWQYHLLIAQDWGGRTHYILMYALHSESAWKHMESPGPSAGAMHW